MRAYVTLLALAAWWIVRFLRRVEHDYERLGRLSSQASTMGWALYLAHAGLTLFASRHPFRPLPMVGALSAASGGALGFLGLWLYAAGVKEFRSFEQISGLENDRLVTSGPYRFSRNPQVAGWGVSLLGTALAGRSSKALLLVAAFFLVHRPYLRIEERHLERAFGEEYRRYAARTPRFLGLPRDG